MNTELLLRYLKAWRVIERNSEDSEPRTVAYAIDNLIGWVSTEPEKQESMVIDLERKAEAFD